MNQVNSAVIMAGGTGGHVFPALAVAKQLIAEGWRVSWLGTRKGIEATLVPAAGIDIDYLDVTGLRGKGAATLLAAPFKLLKACWQAARILRKRAPRIVLGFGGFASGPGGLIAWLKRIPLVIHEQNAIAGTTNRLLAKVATHVLLGFDGALAKGQFVGNPVRSEIFAEPTTHSAVDTQFHLLILGGSLGASALNELLPVALEKLHCEKNMCVRHQTGQRHIEVAKQLYSNAQLQNIEVAIEPFIDDMAAAYQWADLVICRAGALTVAELAAAGRAAVLVPFPYAIDDHQTANANWLVGKGAAKVFQQNELTPDVLAGVLNELIHNNDLRQQMAANAHVAATPNSVKDIVATCREVSR